MRSAPEPFAYIALLNCSVFEDRALFDSVFSRMDKTRQAKVRALRNEKDRLTSLGAGYLSAFLLDQIQGVWKISYEKDGRPVVEDIHGGPAPLFLSVSHSGVYAMAGLSSSPIGVDLEILGEPRMALARHFYTEEENAYILSGDDKTAAFFAIWCKKECRIKRDGFADLRELPVLNVPESALFRAHKLEGYACFSYISKGIEPELLQPAPIAQAGSEPF